jgi:hypothetical protein
MIIYEPTILVISILIVLLLVFLTITKIKKRIIPKRKIVFFLILILFITICRMGLFTYLKIFVMHYDYTIYENILSVFLFPEMPLFFKALDDLKLMTTKTPVYYDSLFWILLFVFYFLGSFLWFFPSLIFFSEKKKHQIISQLDH